MYIDYLDGSALWYWYNYGGIIAGMVATFIFGAIVIGTSSWKPGGIFVKTVLVGSMVLVAQLGLARIGFRMAIGNEELVGYLSMGATGVALATSFIYMLARKMSKKESKAQAPLAGNKTSVANFTQNEPVKNIAPSKNLSNETQLNIHMDDNKTFAVKSEPVTIGRDPSNDVVINHPSVSRKHAQITNVNGKHFIEDLGSMNGITVNGVNAPKSEVKEGATIKLGKVELGIGDTKVNNIRKVKHIGPKKEPVDNLSAVTFIGAPSNDSKEWLTVNNGANAGQVFYLNPGNNTVGRGTSNEISISDPYVSAAHCEFKVADGKVNLYDLGSRTGTKINDQVLRGKDLKPGSTVKVGESELKILPISSPEQLASVTNLDHTIVDMGGTNSFMVVVVSGPDAGTSFIVKEGVNSIGRDANADLKLTDRSVSRRHAVIKCENETLTISDMGSTSGTDVNGVKISGITVSNRDIITIGKTEFIYMAAS